MTRIRTTGEVFDYSVDPPQAVLPAGAEFNAKVVPDEGTWVETGAHSYLLQDDEYEVMP